MEREERGNVITVIVIGLILGALTGAFGFVVTGGGHGLFTALFTCSSLLLAPVAFVGVLRRRDRSGKITMLMIAVIAVCIDIAIGIEGMHEQGFEKVWNEIPAPFAIWITGWLSWQFVVLAALFRPPLRAANE
jgi:hypothetical protein